jgi:hypothetical protein
VQIRQILGTLLFVVVLVATGCTGADDAASGKGDGAASVAPPPDPCKLLDSSTLDELTGSEQGRGKAKALAPDQRKVCVFDSGLSLAVEVGTGFGGTVDLIRASPSGATLEDIDDVGVAALWQDFGDGSGLFLAQGEDYFVGVTVAAGGLAVGQPVAEALLDAL